VSIDVWPATVKRDALSPQRLSCAHEPDRRPGLTLSETVNQPVDQQPRRAAGGWRARRGWRRRRMPHERDVQQNRRAYRGARI